MSRNRQIVLAFVIVLVGTFIGSVAVDQLLLRAFGVQSPWIGGFFIGVFICSGIVVANWITNPHRKS